MGKGVMVSVLNVVREWSGRLQISVA